MGLDDGAAERAAEARALGLGRDKRLEDAVDDAGIKAGAVAIGVGSALVDTKAIAAGNFAPITTNAKSLIESVRAARA